MIQNVKFIANLFVASSFIAGLAYAWFEFLKIKRIEIKNPEKAVITISNIIKSAAITYLFVQFRVLFIVETIIMFLLFKFISLNVAAAFGIGAFFSWISGFIAMYVSVKFNYKVALLARNGFEGAFEAAFGVGKIVALTVNSIALAVCFIITLFATEKTVLMSVLMGLSFGASLISIFARIGGGIFTKGADIGADLVGKLEQGLCEDDPRNPAVIADALGDNVGDACGMSADLFESYIVIVAAAISLIFYTVPKEFIESHIRLVFVILASGIWSGIFSLSSGWKYRKDVKFSSLGISVKTFVISVVVLANVFGYFFFGFKNSLEIFICAVNGIFSAVFIMPLTEYYTSAKFRPVKKIIEASAQGHANNVIQGLAVGLESAFVTIGFIGLSVLISFLSFGLLGIALTCVSMMSICSVVLALDAFGPITDNAGGLVEMGKVQGNAREITDELDTIGNMTKATTKGYAVYSAAMAAFILIALFNLDLVGLFKNGIMIWLNDSLVLVGIFYGAAVVSLFAGMCLTAVNRASMAIMIEVRRQFKENRILEGENEPDYTKAIDILTIASLKEMILPSLLPVFATMAFFFPIKILLKADRAFAGLAGFIVGSTVLGVVLAISMTVSGGAWDNAKKAIEAAGLKGQPIHAAAVTGDTVGDPYKDTAGPSINPMIKLIAIIAILLILLHH
jgi:K(+)-stimulated pyrophosphate-energized sodium pump